ncbi:MAG: hypothetical protein DME42_06095 [Verrucomicrobia bacterium]|nr:MAG: hypothetical protein DME42_06095 [Verrucomicrobiota bacterium]
MTEHGEGPNALGRWRHLTLLISILLLFIASPFVAPLHHGPTILSIVAAIVLLSATYAVSTRKHLVGIAPILSLATIMTNFLLVAVRSYWILVVSHSTIVVLIAFFALPSSFMWCAAAESPRTKPTPRSVPYLLIGYAWTFAYALLEELQPGSFVASITITAHDYVARVMQMRYFNFITLTTVGYGDVVP